LYRVKTFHVPIHSFLIRSWLSTLNSCTIRSLGHLRFPNSNFFTGWDCQPHSQPPTWRTRPLYLYPPEAGWPSYTPRCQIPILVASYDTSGLRWDYSYFPATMRETQETSWANKNVFK
jgi:hypothetical protein